MTFDPGNDADSRRPAFRRLESLNEEELGPGAGFLLQPRKDIEVLTYVREGSLTQEDGQGRIGVLAVGECHRTSMRSGTTHRAVNSSLTDRVHILQCCFAIDRRDARPGAERKRFSAAERRGILRLMASPDGGGGSLRLHGDVRIYSSLLDPGHHAIHELTPGRGAWLHVVKGRVQLFEHGLGAGDGASFEGEAAVSLTALESSEILLIDMG
jgi:hypothetical protein